MTARRHGLALLIYLAGYCAMVFPALEFFSTHIFMDGSDGAQNFWNNWWVRHAVANLQSPWHTDFLYHPHGVTLIGATLNPFNGFCTTVLCWFVNPVTAFNLMVVFSFVATGYFTLLLVREITGSFWPSVFAGAVFTFSPFHTAHAATHMQLVALQWLPLFVFLWIRFLRDPSHRKALLAAVCLFLVLLCDYYYTFYCVLVGVLLFVAKACRERSLLIRDNSLLLPLVTFVVVSLALCGPIFGSLVYEMSREAFAGEHDPVRWRNDVFAFLIPRGGWLFRDWTEAFWNTNPSEDRVEFGSHLGLTVLALGSYGVWVSMKLRRPGTAVTWLLIGILFYLFSLGSEFLVFGVSYPGVPTPYRVLIWMLPGLEISGMPVRMMVITYLAAAILAAIGLQNAWQRVPRLRVLLLPFLVLHGFEVWPGEQKVYRAAITPVLTKLRELPDGAVAGFAGLDPASLYYQTVFEKPITGGYIARWPASRQQILEAQDRLRAAGRYEELMQAGAATYLVRNRLDMPPVSGSGLKLIAMDRQFELYTWARSDLPAIVPVSDPPNTSVRVVPSAGADGRTGIAAQLTLEVSSPDNGGCGFCCAFSLSRSPAQKMSYHHQMELADDLLFKLSMTRDNELFGGNWSTLDADGTARFTLDVTKIPGTERVELYCSLIVFEGRLDQIRRIHRPVKVLLRK